MITIKHSLSDETRKVTELEYHMMMDSDAWTVVEEKEKPKPKPKPKAKKKSTKKKKK
tara:strand:+ start:905 stop:1075 length:171 start_codon:yes stop_codon:yes gene_type:complete